MTNNKSNVELALIELLDLSGKVHRWVAKAVLDVTNECGDPEYVTCRKWVRILGQSLLRLGGKPALHIAYHVPGCLTKDASAIIKEEWQKLGLYVGDPNWGINDFELGVYHESAEAEKLAAEQSAAE